MEGHAPIRYGTVGTILLLFGSALLILGLVTGNSFFTPKPASKESTETVEASEKTPAHTEAEGHDSEKTPAHAEAEGHDKEGHDKEGQDAGHEEGHHGFGKEGPPLWSVLPFLTFLILIAVLPLLPKVSHWWENNKNRFVASLLLGIPVVVYVLLNDKHQVFHSGLEYFQFISLLTGLFIVAGGIHLTGNLIAKPSVNTLLLLIGYLLASVIGTTGAAMVLIYPILRSNLERKYKVHRVIFFIFLVCNTGGLLSPIGDPPLFLGYLKGIDFFWFIKLLPLWVLNGILLHIIYYLIDSYFYRKEGPISVKLDVELEEPIRLKGALNILFLIVIVASVAGSVNTPYREGFMFIMAGVSLLYTHRSHEARVARERNQFSFHAIVEVAAVFLGIFATMMPALILLSTRGSELGVTQPMEYFFATGIFSSFLDNAPTFLCFLALGQGAHGVSAPEMMTAAPVILGAICAGAVFMGANTYIGNAPNFMVRAIAEQQGVKMPSFFGYMAWAAIILIPVFTIVALIFFVLLKFPMF
jgi:Na+/H+ antiporter NhaD/arsenite permease-like protein